MVIYFISCFEFSHESLLILGLMCSVIMKTTLGATFAAQTFVYPVMFVSGELDV